MSELKDSGKRREFATGAVRDTDDNKPAFHLMAYFGLKLPAMQMARGAKKYSARNWEKGMPLSCFLRSALDHMHKFAVGFDDEPHLDAALWNLHCLAEGQERIRRGMWPIEFDDLPKTYAGQHPEFERTLVKKAAQLYPRTRQDPMGHGPVRSGEE